MSSGKLKYSHQKITMTFTQTICPNHIALCTGKKGEYSAEVGALALVFKKSATDLRHKQKILKCKSTIQIVTFSVRTLNRIGQRAEVSVSVVEHEIDIVCIQEHRCHHNEIEIKYHNTGNGWIFVLVSAWKSSINAAIGGIGMLLSPHTLKSLNSSETIQPRIMVAMFNSNPGITIIFCYSPTNTSDKIDLDTFYNELSSLVCSVLKYIVLISTCQTEMGKLLTNFMLENRLTCLNTKFQKKKAKLWTYTNANNAKAQIDYILMNKK